MAISCNSRTVSTNTTAEAGKGYFIDTSSAAHTINLPASPSQVIRFLFTDIIDSDTNSITVGRNSSNIEGSANDFIISASDGVKHLFIQMLL